MEQQPAEPKNKIIEKIYELFDADRAVCDQFTFYSDYVKKALYIKNKLKKLQKRLQKFPEDLLLANELETIIEVYNLPFKLMKSFEELDDFINTQSIDESEAIQAKQNLIKQMNKEQEQTIELLCKNNLFLQTFFESTLNFHNKKLQELLSQIKQVKTYNEKEASQKTGLKSILDKYLLLEQYNIASIRYGLLYKDSIQPNLLYFDTNKKVLISFASIISGLKKINTEIEVSTQSLFNIAQKLQQTIITQLTQTLSHIQTNSTRSNPLCSSELKKLLDSHDYIESLPITHPLFTIKFTNIVKDYKILKNVFPQTIRRLIPLSHPLLKDHPVKMSIEPHLKKRASALLSSYTHYIHLQFSDGYKLATLLDNKTFLCPELYFLSSGEKKLKFEKGQKRNSKNSLTPCIELPLNDEQWIYTFSLQEKNYLQDKYFTNKAGIKYLYNKEIDSDYTYKVERLIAFGNYEENLTIATSGELPNLTTNEKQPQ